MASSSASNSWGPVSSSGLPDPSLNAGSYYHPRTPDQAGKVAVYNVGAHTADSFATKLEDLHNGVASHMKILAANGVQVIFLQARRWVDCRAAILNLG